MLDGGCIARRASSLHTFRYCSLRLIPCVYLGWLQTMSRWAFSSHSRLKLLTSLPAAGKISRAPDGEERPKRKALQAHSIAGLTGSRSGSRATAAITAHAERVSCHCSFVLRLPSFLLHSFTPSHGLPVQRIRHNFDQYWTVSSIGVEETSLDGVLMSPWQQSLVVFTLISKSIYYSRAQGHLLS